MDQGNDKAGVDARQCPLCQTAASGGRCTACGAALQAGVYAIQQLLAQTPHSRVYLARAADGTAVALKELLFARVPSLQELEAFEREARILESLAHPQIPRLLAHFRDGEGAALRLYVAEEYVQGETLQQRLCSGPLPEAEVHGLALQALDALEYLHSRSPRVLHRDVKPANLIQRPDGTLVLVDFGSALESVKGATVRSTLVGTFGYMPLEQLGGTVDVTSDLYALGATLVHLLGGRAPDELFRPEKGLALDHLDHLVVMRPWLRKMTAPRPADRFRSTAQSRRALPPIPAATTAIDRHPIGSSDTLLAQLAEAASGIRAREAAERSRAAERASEQESIRRAEPAWEDDRLTVLDFYRLAASSSSHPETVHLNSWLIGLVGTILLSKLTGISLERAPVAAVGWIAAHVAAAYAYFAGPTVWRAFAIARAFRRLGFPLHGVGLLLRASEGTWRHFRFCTLHLHMQERPDADRPTSTIQGDALRVLADRLQWKSEGAVASGPANWRTGGELVLACADVLAPLQVRAGLIKSVRLELTPESYRVALPDGD